MAQNKKWALRPGEKLLEDAYEIQRKERVATQYDKLVAQYLKEKKFEPLILNDTKDVVFFIVQDQETLAVQSADVAVFDGFQYTFLPQELAMKTTLSYLAYVGVMGEVYAHIDFPSEGEAK